ncbi:WXG100 family type VII secretion target [Mycobacterium sp. BMJ-28]
MRDVWRGNSQVGTNGGSDGVLDVHVPGVITSAQGIDDVNTEIKAAFEQLKGEGDEVIEGSWTGTAATKLDEGWQQWQQGIHKIVVALEQATGLVMESANRFQRQDEGGR